MAPWDALYPTMRDLSDSKTQPTHHHRESDMNKKAAKGAAMIKTNPRGEYNAVDVIQKTGVKTSKKNNRVKRND